MLKRVQQSAATCLLIASFSSAAEISTQVIPICKVAPFLDLCIPQVPNGPGGGGTGGEDPPPSTAK